MQRLEVSGAVRPIYGSLGVKRLKNCSRVADAGAAPTHGAAKPREPTCRKTKGQYFL